jgi:hypothetical protein
MLKAHEQSEESNVIDVERCEIAGQGDQPKLSDAQLPSRIPRWVGVAAWWLGMALPWLALVLRRTE